MGIDFGNELDKLRNRLAVDREVRKAKEEKEQLAASGEKAEAERLATMSGQSWALRHGNLEEFEQLAAWLENPSRFLSAFLTKQTCFPAKFSNDQKDAFAKEALLVWRAADPEAPHGESVKIVLTDA